MTNQRLRIWELALLLALCVGTLSGVWAERMHTELASQMVRLHVLAVDDSEGEQAVKLAVRDAVLEYLQPVLADAQNVAGAQETLTVHLARVQQAAQKAAEGRTVTVSLSEEQYPTREYDGFSLPAGRYMSLRVTLGEGQGRNWWCVVYPPLCITAATASREAMETLAGDTAAIITEQEGYVYKFRLLELWGQLMEKWK